MRDTASTDTARGTVARRARDMLLGAVRRARWALAGIPGELRAGVADARRTAGAVPWHGRRFGDLAYAAGYAYGAVSQ